MIDYCSIKDCKNPAGRVVNTDMDGFESMPIFVKLCIKHHELFYDLHYNRSKANNQCINYLKSVLRDTIKQLRYE